MGHLNHEEYHQIVCPRHRIPIDKDAVCEACHAGLPAAPPMFLTLLSARNKARCEASFHTMDTLPPEWWSNAMAGECGEACNVTKKMSRLAMGVLGWNKVPDQDMHVLVERLKREIGDVMIYADLLATRIGTTSAECIRLAFNEKSEEIGSDIVV